MQCRTVALLPLQAHRRHLVTNASARLLEYRKRNSTHPVLLTMTRSELIAKLASRYRSLTAADVEASVSVILTAIADRLAEGGRVEIRGFGTFTANYRPPRIGRNPKTAAAVAVPAKYAPHFKPGSELRVRVAASAMREKRIAPAKVRELEFEPG